MGIDADIVDVDIVWRCGVGVVSDRIVKVPDRRDAKFGYKWMRQFKAELIFNASVSHDDPADLAGACAIL